MGDYFSSTVDAFIFMGTNFRGLNENDTFVGFKIRGHSIFPSYVIQKITNSCVLEFMDRTLHENHENWYPTKINPSTVPLSVSIRDQFFLPKTFFKTFSG